MVPTADGRCGCDWCRGSDWPKIAAASVAILESGIDPLHEEAVAELGQAFGLSDEDLGWLLSLFSPRDGIVHLRDCGQFTNGMHRTHALRMAGVERVVVYTGKASGQARSDHWISVEPKRPKQERQLASVTASRGNRRRPSPEHGKQGATGFVRGSSTSRAFRGRKSARRSGSAILRSPRTPTRTCSTLDYAAIIG